MKTMNQKPKLLLAAGILCLMVSAQASRAENDGEMIRDGNFEVPYMDSSHGSTFEFGKISGWPNPQIPNTIGQIGTTPWMISPNGEVELILNNGASQSPLLQPTNTTLGAPTYCFNTPNERQFILLASDTTLSQDIVTPLKAGKNYRLTFLQSSFYSGPPGNSLWSAEIPGKVQFELVPTASPGATNLLGVTGNNGIFLVPPQNDWGKQTSDFTVAGLTGKYTIRIISFDRTGQSGDNFGTIIDAVSLRERN